MKPLIALCLALVLAALLVGGTVAVSGSELANSKPASYVEGPCRAIHYGRPGYSGEVSMEQVVRNRQTPGKHYIKGYKPRKDVVGQMAVKYADRWRIARNHRALVVFRTPYGYSQPMWLQASDYQQRRHMTSGQCRTEISERLARSMGWSLWQGWGRMDSWIIRWEGK